MKKFYSRVLSLCLFLLTSPVWARDLESIATNLSSKTNTLVLKISPIGFGIAALFMYFGNPRGTQLMSLTLMGSLCVLGGSSVINWLRSIAG